MQRYLMVAKMGLVERIRYYLFFPNAQILPKNYIHFYPAAYIYHSYPDQLGFIGQSAFQNESHFFAVKKYNYRIKVFCLSASGSLAKRLLVENIFFLQGIRKAAHMQKPRLHSFAQSRHYIPLRCISFCSIPSFGHSRHLLFAWPSCAKNSITQ
jgi:hypothetical protein